MNAAVHPNIQPAKRSWSENQLGCFEHAAIGEGNAIIKAVAGSGKPPPVSRW